MMVINQNIEHAQYPDQLYCTSDPNKTQMRHPLQGIGEHPRGHH